MATVVPDKRPAAKAVNGDMSASSRHVHSELQSLNGTAEVLEELGIAADLDASAGGDEIELLRIENTEFRQRVAKLEQVLKDTSGTAQFWAEQNKNTEKLLEEKSDLI